MKTDDSASLNPRRTIVLIGMMGAGKSAVGRKLAVRLKLPFVDSDSAIEEAAGMNIADFFERRGEAEFRDGERRVIARLLEQPPCVLATGGGAFMDDETRTLVQAKAISVWLRAGLDTLVTRATRRDDRPLLRGGNPRERMEELLTKREKIYAEADITVDSDDRPIDDTVERVLEALEQHGRKGKKKR